MKTIRTRTGEATTLHRRRWTSSRGKTTLSARPLSIELLHLCTRVVVVVVVVVMAAAVAVVMGMREGGGRRGREGDINKWIFFTLWKNERIRLLTAVGHEAGEGRKWG